MKEYTTNCVNSTAESIDAMYRGAKEIDYMEFIEQVDVEQLQALFPGYDWSEDKPKDLTLKDDWAVSFWESVFMGIPCLYVEHSRIEYIFC